MKQLFIILLLLSIGAKPLFQLGHIVYYGMNIAYVVEKYCINKEKSKLNCNGKCYLMQQLSSANTTAEDQDNGIPSSIEIFIPLFFQSNTYKHILILKPVRKTIDLGTMANYFSPVKQVNLPPPKI